MIAGLPIGFTSPLLLLALLALPILWWLLRLIPPRPRRIAFPPTRIQPARKNGRLDECASH